MRTHELSKWDVGQDLSYCADILSDKETELNKAGFETEAKVLNYCRHLIGEAFNALKSHEFGLPSFHLHNDKNKPVTAKEIAEAFQKFKPRVPLSFVVATRRAIRDKT